ncbi:MAG: phosphoribosylformylglycinamidine cyclo-ligase [Myxococcota bacterium]
MASDDAPPRAGLSYRDAGVDIDAGNEAVQRIARLVSRTRRPEQLGALGGFAGMFSMPSGLTDPVLVSCADGVGTKLLVAIAMEKHDTVGIDLVAMNVNDLIVTGADPMFVLDYIACAAVVPATIEALVAGVVEGCVQSSAALLGGETAELPGMYAEGHYDLAAFAVGVVERAKTLGPDRVRAGDVVLGLPSSGLHSNGYSLARKALLSEAHAGLALGDPLPSDPNVSVGQALLTPTKIYVPHLEAARSAGDGLHAAAHITGGGLVENPPRALPDTLAMDLDLGAVTLPPVLAAVAAAGVDTAEMRRTFNCGVGMLLVVDPDAVAAVTEAVAAVGEPPVALGRVVPRSGDPQVHLSP